MSAEDRLAIERLVLEYADCIDASAPVPDKIAAFFTADADRVGPAAGLVQKGREEIREFFRETHFTRPTHHFITNQRVDVAEDGVHATATSYILFYGRLLPKPGQAEGRLITRTGRYRNSCVKVDGAWLFDRMEIIF